MVDITNFDSPTFLHNGADGTVKTKYFKQLNIANYESRPCKDFEFMDLANKKKDRFVELNEKKEENNIKQKNSFGLQKDVEKQENKNDFKNKIEYLKECICQIEIDIEEFLAKNSIIKM